MKRNKIQKEIQRPRGGGNLRGGSSKSEEWKSGRNGEKRGIKKKKRNITKIPRKN